MKVTAATCDTSAYILCIILEVHSEERFCGTESADAVVHFDSLLRCGKKICCRIISNRHIVEEPCKISSALDQMIEVLLAAYCIYVCRCVACGNTERKSVALQKLHGMHNLLVYAISTSSVCSCLCSLKADSRNKVFHTEHFLTEFFVNKSSVCEGKELAVRMHLTDLNKVFFADKRLTACVDVHISSQLFTLFNNRIDGLKIQVQFVAILCCPASCAVKVTCAGWVKKDCPRYIAVILFGYFFLCCASLKAGIYNKVTEECLAYSRIQLIHTKDQLIPVVLCLDGVTDRISLSCIPAIRCYFINHFHNLRYICLRILLKIIQCFCYGSCDRCLFCFVYDSHTLFPPMLLSKVIGYFYIYV
jgi:hypothetical protein